MNRAQLEAELLKVLLRFFREPQHWDDCACHDDGVHVDSILIRELLAKLEALPLAKTAKIVLDDIKDPDGWQEVLHKLGLVSCDEDGNDTSTETHQRLVKEHFKWGEYASLELEIDEDLNVVGGKVL